LFAEEKVIFFGGILGPEFDNSSVNERFQDSWWMSAEGRQVKI
jgi:hypothetical protein